MNKGKQFTPHHPPTHTHTASPSRPSPLCTPSKLFLTTYLAHLAQMLTRTDSDVPVPCFKDCKKPQWLNWESACISREYFSVDEFLFSHHLSVERCIDIVGRNMIFIKVISRERTQKFQNLIVHVCSSTTKAFIHLRKSCSCSVDVWHSFRFQLINIFWKKKTKNI